jgi:hypothetical protein
VEGTKSCPIEASILALLNIRAVLLQYQFVFQSIGVHLLPLHAILAPSTDNELEGNRKCSLADAIFHTGRAVTRSDEEICRNYQLLTLSNSEL